MNSRHVLDQLSAYIDGESEHPEAIARHLQQCADCARRHVELSRLSVHVQTLRGPKVHPAFLTRVMAHVAEARPLGAPWWARGGRWLRAGIVTAALLLAVGTSVLLSHSPTPPPDNMAAAPAPNLDENALMQQIQDKVAQGHYSVVLDNDPWVSISDENNSDDSNAFEAVETLARVFDADPAIAPADDVDWGIEELDTAEAQAFAELLRAYAQEG